MSMTTEAVSTRTVGAAGENLLARMREGRSARAAQSQEVRPTASWAETRLVGRTAATTQAQPGVAGRRWPALIVIAVAQLMIALDATVVNIALPSAQAALRFSDPDRQW